ncbi:MAG: ParB/RepB/Spo0J family partition protein [Bifidobacteriaceae bacterium]|jgi:ParB family chromosome partitioning protein|nr:ParB/RepB/Spo0J family partition protein [Bifidobacteriaceae bacterium]MCI1978513.1 ParB/RepB/Spo0J family partition protein [Bifidobacteriaceae bacterium]
MAKSRLGKGLGALFPTIPEEKAPNTLLDLEAQAEAEETAQKKSAAEKKVQSPKAVSKKSAKKVAQTGKNTRGAAKAVTDSRMPIPDWSSIAHPSDMFFSNTREVAHSQERNVSRETSASSVSQQQSDSVHPDSDGVNAGNVNAGKTGKVSTKTEQSAETSQTSAKDGGTPQGEAAPQLKEVKGAYLAELNIDDIEPNEFQPRSVFGEDELQELSDSIKEVGVLQPIVVRRVAVHSATGSESSRSETSQEVANPTSAEAKVEGKNSSASYELIMGERRLRASKLAGKTTIPAIVKTTEDSVMLRDALLENLHRVQLNPLEEAAAYQQMITEFGLTQAQLSQSVSKSRPQIANTLRLLQLPGSVQKRVASGVLSAGHARALLGLDSEKQMLDLATRIVAEGLSVRSTEEIVALQHGTTEMNTKRPRKKSTFWASSELPQKLEDHFDTKVTIRGDEKKGKIEITFSSQEDLQRITNMLVGEKTNRSQDGWV